MNEREWQSQVLDLARIFRWRVAHFRPAFSGRGWRTPVAADGAGFPDLVLCRPPRLVFAELKRDGARPTPAQQDWLDELGRCVGVESYVWRPSDLEAVALALQ